MNNFRNRIADKCLDLLKKKIDLGDNKITKDTNEHEIILYLPMAIVSQNSKGLDPLAAKIRKVSFTIDYYIEVIINRELVLIKSSFFNRTLFSKEAFELYDKVNEYNLHSLNSKSYIRPEGVQFVASYNLHTYRFTKDEILTYKDEYIVEIILFQIQSMIEDIECILTNKTLFASDF